MPEFYGLEEIRLVQVRNAISAANADSVAIGPVPAGKIWTVTGISYLPSVAETQVVSFQKLGRDGVWYCINNPISLNLNPACAGIEYALPVPLFPGENIRAMRLAHTAGSTMSLVIQFIESDLPLYDYIEPQAAAKLKRFGTTIARRVAGGAGAAGGGGGRPAGFRGGGAKPK